MGSSIGMVIYLLPYPQYLKAGFSMGNGTGEAINRLSYIPVETKSGISMGKDRKSVV